MRIAKVSFGCFSRDGEPSPWGGEPPHEEHFSTSGDVNKLDGAKLASICEKYGVKVW
jgi:hypothetical protein